MIYSANTALNTPQKSWHYDGSAPMTADKNCAVILWAFHIFLGCYWGVLLVLGRCLERRPSVVSDQQWDNVMCFLGRDISDGIFVVSIK